MPKQIENSIDEMDFIFLYVGTEAKWIILLFNK
jgi:hypothetical protein